MSLEEVRGKGWNQVVVRILLLHLCLTLKLLEVMDMSFIVDEDPKTFKEAMRSMNASFWREVVNSELNSIIATKTLQLVDLPIGNMPISYK